MEGAVGVHVAPVRGLGQLGRIHNLEAKLGGQSAPATHKCNGSVALGRSTIGI